MGEAGVSDSTLSACVTARACKPVFRLSARLDAVGMLSDDAIRTQRSDLFHAVPEHLAQYLLGMLSE